MSGQGSKQTLAARPAGSRATIPNRKRRSLHRSGPLAVNPSCPVNRNPCPRKKSKESKRLTTRPHGDTRHASLSSQIVTGPSFVRLTAISAPNLPFATGTPSPSSAAAKAS